MKLRDDARIDAVNHQGLLHLVQFGDGAGDLRGDCAGTALRRTRTAGEALRRRHGIFRDQKSLACALQFIGAGESADKEFKLVPVFLIYFAEDQADADGVMRGFDFSPSADNGIAHTDHEEDFRANRQAGDSLNVTAGQADVAQVAEHGRCTFLAAEFDASGAVKTLLASPGSLCFWHNAPYSVRRPHGRGRLTGKSGGGSGGLCRIGAEAGAEQCLSGLDAANADLPCFGGVAPDPYDAAARLPVSVLKRDDLAFAHAINPDEPRADGAGIHRTRVLHEGPAIRIHSPHFHFEAYRDPWLRPLQQHKTSCEIALMVLANGSGFNGLCTSVTFILSLRSKPLKSIVARRSDFAPVPRGSARGRPRRFIFVANRPGSSMHG